MSKTAIKADRPGLSLTAGLTTTSGALPLDSRQRSPSAVRVAVVPNASVHLRTGSEGVVAAGADLLLNGGSTVVVDSSGATHIAVIEAGIGLGGLVNVVPYE